MKILYIHTLYAPHISGGAEITLKTLVEGMRERGCEVVVLTTGQNVGLHEDMVDGVRVLRVGLENSYWHFSKSRPPTWKRGIWHLRDIYNNSMGNWVERIVMQEKPDVVSCHNLTGFSAAAWRAIKKTGTPSIQVLHDMYNLCANSNMFRNGHACKRQCLRCKAFRLFHPKLSESVDAVVGVSHFILDRHIKSGYFRNAKLIRIIHNARSMIVENDTKAAAQSNITVRFGFIGTLTPAKGVEFLLGEFSQAGFPNAELHIAGCGKEDYESSLRVRFKARNVIFWGYSNPQSFLATIDVLVVPSLWEEPLGMIVAEAFAFGIPVIGSRRGGIPEMVEDGVNGLLFEPDNPNELIDAMNRMYREVDFRESLSLAAKEDAIYFHDMDRFLSCYEEVYREVCEQTLR